MWYFLIILDIVPKVVFMVKNYYALSSLILFQLLFFLFSLPYIHYVAKNGLELLTLHNSVF